MITISGYADTERTMHITVQCDDAEEATAKFEMCKHYLTKKKESA